MKSRRIFAIGMGMLLAMILVSARAGPPTTLRAPADLKSKVGFDQKLGARIPLDTVFKDARGRSLHLRDLLNDKPTLLVPGYYGCINLCSVVRAGVAHAVAASGLEPGKQFNVVLVSINPDEGPKIAASTKQNDAGVHTGAFVPQWHYLTGTRTAIQSLMHSIGFRYFYDARNGQYDHDAGVVLLSSKGAVTQYLFGVQFAPRTLRLALVQASKGKIGNVVDHFLLLCCNYDPSTGHYSLVIHRVMQALGILTVLVLIALIALLRRSELRRRKRMGS